jgi:hypothetical protein
MRKADFGGKFGACPKCGRFEIRLPGGASGGNDDEIFDHL